MSGLLERVARRTLLRGFGHLRVGQVRLVEDAGGFEQRFGVPAPDLDEVELRVLDPRFYRAVLAGGTLGGGEAWIRGLWTCSDLTTLVRVLIRNQSALQALDPWVSRFAYVAQRGLHALRRNTRRGARRNIAAHYDLGNDFFALFLDPTLTYSSGVFERPDATMEEASVAKYERICRKLDLGAGDHVLEIGTGWGGFALHAARTRGCRVTTTTLSKEQRALALERIEKAGLSERIEVLLEDYRDLRGTYDRLVSIEMIEAVGHAYFDDYFRACSERLAPHGSMALQAILIDDRYYERARHSVDFVKRFVFPGGALPSRPVIDDCVSRVTDFHCRDVEDITPHYAETLRRWRARFRGNLSEIRALGYSEEHLRMWEFYLCYCEAGFEERYNRCVQMVLDKPQAKGRASA